MKKTIDRYFNKPIITDISCAVIVVLLESLLISPLFTKFNLPYIHVLEKEESTNYLSNLISTSISLTGFIIAALTIMVTVKSSLKARGYEDSPNALEYLFTTRHYKSIIKTFKDSIIELLIASIALYITWLVFKNLNSLTIQRILFSTTLCCTMALLRSIYILFTVLGLEFLKND